MDKDAILRCLDEVSSKLGELRAALEHLPDTAEQSPLASSADQRNKETPPDRPGVVRVVDKEKLQSVVNQAFVEMNICGEPVGAEKLQEMIAACGVKPEGNVFSQEIISMREE
jgi:hypothetical protein